MPHLSEELLNFYLDKELDQVSQQSVESHLATCKECRTHLNDLELLFSALEELPDIPLARDLTKNVLASIPKITPVPALWRQPAFIFQSILTIIFVAVGMPMIKRLDEEFSIWINALILPAIELPSFVEMVSQLAPLLKWDPQYFFTLPKISLSAPSLPTIPSFSFSTDTNHLLFLVASAVILWMVGNIALLRNNPEVQE